MKLLKQVDICIGPGIASCVRLLFPTKRNRTVKNDAFLFIRPGGIGDAVLLVPAVSALKRVFPKAIIDILAEKRNSAIFSMCPSVNRVYHYENLSELFAAICGHYDGVIDTEQWHRLSAVAARLTRAPMLIGFATNEREKIFTHKIPYSQDDHEIDSFNRLIKPLIGDATAAVKPPFLTVPDAAQEKTDSILRPLQSRRFVAIFPGGSIRERQWGSVRFHAVARMLITRGYGIAVVGDRKDIESGREIVSGLANALDICGKATLLETAAVLKNASLLITGDSGIMHIAYGLGTSTVSLFGPGIEMKWAPRGENHIVINKHLPCSPCTKFGYTPRCKRNAECMKLITPEEVFEKVMELLEGKTHAADRH